MTRLHFSARGGPELFLLRNVSKKNVAWPVAFLVLRGDEDLPVFKNDCEGDRACGPVPVHVLEFGISERANRDDPSADDAAEFFFDVCVVRHVVIILSLVRSPAAPGRACASPGRIPLALDLAERRFPKDEGGEDLGHRGLVIAEEGDHPRRGVPRCPDRCRVGGGGDGVGVVVHVVIILSLVLLGLCSKPLDLRDVLLDFFAHLARGDFGLARL